MGRYAPYIAIAAAVACALFVVWVKSGVVGSGTEVQLAISSRELKDFVSKYGYSTEYVLENLSRAGVSAVAVEELTLEELENSGDVLVRPALEFLPQGYDAVEGLYVFSSNAELLKWLARRFTVLLGQDNVRVLPTGIIWVNSNRAWLSKLPLGFWEGQANWKVQLARIPVVKVYDNLPLDYLYHSLDTLAYWKDSNLIIFQGLKAVEGYDRLRDIAAKVELMGRVLVVTEFSSQAGMDNLARLINYNVVRATNVARPIDGLLAARERNIRLFNFVKLLPGSGQDALELNAEWISGFRDELVGAGFKISDALRGFGDYKAPRVLLIVMMFGVAGGAVLFLRQLCGEKRFLESVTWVLIGIFSALFALRPEYVMREGFALAAAVVFPTLAILKASVFPTENTFAKSPVTCGLVMLLVACAWSVAGGIIVNGLLVDTNYSLQLRMFRGVKIAYIAPVVLLLTTYVGRRINLKHLTSYWQRPVFLLDVVILGLMALGLYIYVGRSGNEGWPVSQIETLWRQLLQGVLLVRPRNKEILIGHPALIIAGLCAYLAERSRTRSSGAENCNGASLSQIVGSVAFWPLLVVGVVGQVSIVNSFSHIHTPVSVTILRTFNGLWLGILLGIAAMGILWNGFRKWDSISKDAALTIKKAWETKYD